MGELLDMCSTEGCCNATDGVYCWSCLRKRRQARDEELGDMLRDIRKDERLNKENK